MARCSHHIWSLLLAGLVAGSGCSSHSRKVVVVPSGTTGTAATAAVGANTLSLEARAEAHARFAAGLSYELSDKQDRALQEFVKAAQADPGSEELVVDVAQTLLQAKKFDQAEAVLQKACAQPKPAAMVFSQLGLVHLLTGHTNAAIEVNQAGIKRLPNSSVCYLNLFHLLAQTGRTAEAAKLVDQAAAVRQPDADFLVDLAELYRARDRVLKSTNTTSKVKAIAALDGAASQNPTNFVVLSKMAESYARLGEAKKAADVFLKLGQQFPELPNLRERLAELFMRGGDTKKAAEQLEGIIRKNPTNPQAYYFLGAIAHEEKRFKDAADYYRKTLLLDPHFEQVYYDLALSQVASDQPKEALEVLDKAQKQFGQTFVGEFVSALAWGHLKDYTNALRHYTAAEVVAEATDTNRLTHLFYFQYGAAFERVGRLVEAEKYLRKCLEMSPDFGEALNYLGYMWADKGTNLTEARVMIEKALKQEPKNGAFLDSLGWVLFRQGHVAEALGYIQQAVDLTPEPDATLFEHLGDIQAALHESAKAREAWEKSLKLEPNPEIRKKLERLRP